MTAARMPQTHTGIDPAPRLVLGVAGGGTKTDARLWLLQTGEAARELGTGLAGASNLRTAKRDSAAAELLGAIQKCCDNAGVKLPKVHTAVLALAGAGDPAVCQLASSTVCQAGFTRHGTRCPRLRRPHGGNRARRARRRPDRRHGFGGLRHRRRRGRNSRRRLGLLDRRRGGALVGWAGRLYAPPQWPRTDAGRRPRCSGASWTCSTQIYRGRYPP